MMGATVAGFGGVVERARLAWAVDMGRLKCVNCLEARASRDGNWAMRFILEVVVGARRCPVVIIIS